MAQITSPALTPDSPVKYTIENPNCMNRIVQWFRDDETSTVLKVGVLVLAGLALIGAGFLAGQPLVSLLGALPLALWAWREWGVLNKNIEEEAQRGPMPPGQAVAAAQKAFAIVDDSPTATDFEKMQAAVGGAAKYNQLPVLDISNHPPKDYIDWLRPEDLAFPVMKGEFLQRPFIALKIKDKGVITFFQRYVNAPNPFWTCGRREDIFNFNVPLEKEDRANIHKLVVQKNHPRYTLAE